MYRIRIESCENADEGYTFDHETLAGVIALCITELSSDEYSQLDLPEAMATLVAFVIELFAELGILPTELHGTPDAITDDSIVEIKTAPTISTGEPSTLKTYRKLAAALTGEDSPATKMLDAKIKEQGEDAEVIQHESQMLLLIATLGTKAQ